MSTIKLTFSGDIMLDKPILENYLINNKYLFDDIFSKIKPFLEKSDYIIGNLETPISANKKDYIKGEYQFTSPIEFAEAVKKAGFTLVSTANNHCLDNGEKGIIKTLNCLNNIELDNTGISDKNQEFFIKDINNMKIGFLSYTYGTNAFSNNIYLKNKNINVNLFQNQELSNPITRFIYRSNNIVIKIIRKISYKLHLFQLHKNIYERKEFSFRKKIILKRSIKKCKKAGAEYIIMLMHMGGQYNKEATKATKKLAHYLQKIGIDLIIGNHEHVIHECEINNQGVILYSLGNFLSTAGVLEKPFDKLAEYSLLINTYLEKNDNSVKLSKCTFTILKTILDKKHNILKVVPLYDLINNCLDEKEKTSLIKNNNEIYMKVLNRENKAREILLEYEII